MSFVVSLNNGKEYWKRICLLTAIPDWNKDSEIVTEVERLRKKYEDYRKRN